MSCSSHPDNTLGRMTEEEFIRSIDCCFPYENPIQWRRLSAKAARISSNAAFMVLHEVCRVPRSGKVRPRTRRRIATHLCARFRHPALRIAMPAIEAYLKGEKLRPAKAARAMCALSSYPGEFNALAICYFSSIDRNGRLDRMYEKVLSSWAGRAEVKGAP